MIIFDKKMSRMRSSILMLGAIAFLSLHSGCDKNRNRPGYSYFPDMEQSQAYETYTENPAVNGGKTNLLPPANTIPREMIPYDFEKTEVNRTWAGQMLENPFEGDPETLADGKRLFGIYCMNCHGELGDGKGFLYTSEKYKYPPASLLSDKIRNKPDGEIFHVISIGWGLMGAHGSQVNSEERWKIISFIRNELQN